MKSLSSICIIFTLISLSLSSYAAKKPKALIFTETKGYFHENIPFAVETTKKMLEAKGFAVETTRESDGFFTPKKLKEYKTLIFINTTGAIFSDEEKEAFIGYIKKGGGFVGVHGATDTEMNWEFYYKLVGGTFRSHPHQQKAKINVTDKAHPATAMLPDVWENFDEWYDFNNFNENVNVLAWLDETSYEGGGMGEKHPIIWCHEYEGGRAFYTGIGHTEDCFRSPVFLDHLYHAVKWTAKLK